ncbi:MAG: histidinol-phosphate transaminase [Candidatus Peribacteraceae bacterium]|nr:histidinol-phosphate transaminase [Candidatus Peribacteraceae bacterium]
MQINFAKLAKKSVRASAAYSSARSLVSKAKVFLDANENSFGSVLPKISKVDLSRYPDPLAERLCEQYAKYAGVAKNKVLIGNGSDEIIWLLLLAFVEANEEILTTAPTFSMYRVFAELLGLKVSEVALEEDYSLDIQKFLKKVSAKTKLIFLCSPNNPTGQTVPCVDVEKVLRKGKLVIVDEAYIEFSPQKSCAKLLKQYPNLIILRTFSKAWGLAGLRVGVALADSAVIAILQKVRAPYSVDGLSQQLALDALTRSAKMKVAVKKILSEREKLTAALWKLGLIVSPSEANFLLVQFPSGVSATKVYEKLVKQFGIVVRDFSAKKLLKNSLRITVGTPAENSKLAVALKKILK